MLTGATGAFEKTSIDTFFLSDENKEYVKSLTFKNQNSLLMQYMEQLNLAYLQSQAPILNISDYPSSGA
jgi:hypothetical protein